MNFSMMSEQKLIKSSKRGDYRVDIHTLVLISTEQGHHRCWIDESFPVTIICYQSSMILLLSSTNQYKLLLHPGPSLGRLRNVGGIPGFFGWKDLHLQVSGDTILGV